MSTAILNEQGTIRAMDADMEVIHVIFNEGEEKPWEITFDDISGLKRARAILNYPVHKFETEEKATEVAEMLRDIIKADAVDVEGELGLRDDVEPAPFFHSVAADEDLKGDNHRHQGSGVETAVPVAGAGYSGLDTELGTPQEEIITGRETVDEASTRRLETDYDRPIGTST